MSAEFAYYITKGDGLVLGFQWRAQLSFVHIMPLSKSALFLKCISIPSPDGNTFGASCSPEECPGEIILFLDAIYV